MRRSAWFAASCTIPAIFARTARNGIATGVASSRSARTMARSAQVTAGWAPPPSLTCTA
ncbi:hypothetical protein PF006_g16050 [Phytophthora fragariae]|uniref:Uncharacterized protein n=1 Tax=Phytophthora fragariae TaxID=53985 RepID=A0A6A3T4B7_9STRA|nr:hypothetical protein PF006_g16050 [Phytophthora fragariae]